jgi:hypothetical protein
MRGLAISACLLAGCAASQPSQVLTKVVDSGCDWARPILISKSDALTDGTAKQILEHNKAGSKACSWKPSR